jgi:hypothetical protein
MHSKAVVLPNSGGAAIAFFALEGIDLTTSTLGKKHCVINGEYWCKLPHHIQ